MLLRSVFLFIVLSVLVACIPALAQDETGKVLAKGGKMSGKLDMLAERGAAIKAALDSADLKLPEDIGKLIDEARLSGDPDSSWDVALLLHSAEQKSGKVCEFITAKQLIDEATAKAHAAHDTTALVMASHAYQLIGDSATSAALMTEYSAAVAAPVPTPKAGRYTFDLVVVNNTGEPLDVYCCGNYRGMVPDGYRVTFYDRSPVDSRHYFYAVGRYSGTSYSDTYYAESWDVIRYNLS